MKLSIKQTHKDYIFVETDMDLEEDDANVICLKGHYTSNKWVYLYVIYFEWWKANKTKLLYENRIKIA